MQWVSDINLRAEFHVCGAFIIDHFDQQLDSTKIPDRDYEAIDEMDA
jgi:hypothetical protein